jgi:hypothetical protein
MVQFSRYIPVDVREKLRQEVNFGCPVHECGIPYLKYHHFDPPFSILEKMNDPKHEPKKMIALCSMHVDFADGRKWLDDDLRKMKNNPYITDVLKSKKYGYFRKKIVTMIGNIAYDVPNVLEIDDERIIGFERDSEGNLRLNILIRDVQGKKILVMENNDWTVHPNDLFDLECTPQQREIRIKSKDGKTEFKMRFDDYTLDEFRELLLRLQQPTESEIQEREKQLEWMKNSFGEEQFNQAVESFTNPNPEMVNKFVDEMSSYEPVTVFSATGTLSWGNSFLKITNRKIEDQKRHNVFRSNFVMGGKCAFSFKQSAAIGIGGN